MNVKVGATRQSVGSATNQAGTTGVGLAELAVENLGPIAAATLPFGKGLTAITGETGAGKTMLLTAIDLLRGGRADLALLRSGTERALASGILVLPANHLAALAASDLGASFDDAELVAVRTVTASRSRAVIGGCPVPSGKLAELIGPLIAVHGQAEQFRLTGSAQQRELLDKAAGAQHLAALHEHQQTYESVKQLEKRINDLLKQTREDQAVAESLKAGLAAIQAAKPQAGELDELASQLERLAGAEERRCVVSTALMLLTGADDPEGDSNSVASLLQNARRSLASVPDPALTAISERLTDLTYQVDDLVTELNNYLINLQADPATLEALQQRRAQLQALTRRFGPTLDDVRQWATQAEQRLADLDGGSQTIERLTEQLNQTRAWLAQSAATVRQGREAVAKRLIASVNHELVGLAMPQARFDIELTEIELGFWGGDEVSFRLASHTGAPARPLGKGASGGELSRIMLAVEVSLATAGPDRPVLVFDEIDAGVGGQAAIEVGRRLARLAEHGQVIVVTHLAQVAAFASQQIVVQRQDTETTAVVVQGQQRVVELARMLAGQGDSNAAQTHASELLQLAEQFVSSDPHHQC
ncbi:MAG: DNA repair protein RecN [Bifidobacteriaceae bacterium]|nr:DNA repair protein RecN [Bifidobacteriaceae bacterium]